MFEFSCLFFDEVHEQCPFMGNSEFSEGEFCMFLSEYEKRKKVAITLFYARNIHFIPEELQTVRFNTWLFKIFILFFLRVILLRN